METLETGGDWGSPLETPESRGDQWSVQRLKDLSRDSTDTGRDPRDWGSPLETPEAGSIASK